MSSAGLTEPEKLTNSQCTFSNNIDPPRNTIYSCDTKISKCNFFVQTPQLERGNRHIGYWLKSCALCCREYLSPLSISKKNNYIQICQYVSIHSCCLSNCTNRFFLRKRFSFWDGTISHKCREARAVLFIVQFNVKTYVVDFWSTLWTIKKGEFIFI